MFVSQKCQYALRALFELSFHAGDGPRKVVQIAEAQAIPPRFLEVILGELKRGGFVASRRGRNGGYLVARAPADITVGDVVRFVQGPVGPKADPSARRAAANGVFDPMWQRVRESINAIYDHTNFANLVEDARRRTDSYVPNYVI